MKRNVTITIEGTLGLFLVILKLSGTVDWSWMYVLMPFYLPIFFALVSAVLLGILVAIFPNKER